MKYLLKTLSLLKNAAKTAFTCFIVLTIATSCSKSDSKIDEEPNDNNPDTETPTPQNIATPNVLLIIADDMGMDSTPYATQLNTTKPTMPNLDKLMQDGIRFNNAWAYPRCTPTRGTIITGKHGRTTGLLQPSDVIDDNENTLQTYINTNGSTEYATAVIGKWHLGRNSRNIENMGIDYYKGNTGGGLTDYYNWTLHEDGITTEINNYYGTTAYTDYAIDWIKNQDKPWFCWLAYNAAHSTFHTPKDASLFTHQGATTLDMYIQMLEAMDSEMGKLFDSIPAEVLANTTIIFVGDNGTPGQTAQSPFVRGKSKGSLYNGGINVPLIVSGANVNRKNVEENSLIQTTDLFATIADLCEVDNPNANESISFKTLLQSETNATRTYSYAEGEANGPAFGGYTVRNSKYKYIYNEDNNTHYLFNLENDYAEEVNLYDGNLTQEEQTALNALQAEANRIRN